MVLGVNWLRTLGPILWDFSHMTMQYTLKGHATTLKGVTSSGLSFEDDAHFLKSSPSDTKGILLKLLSGTTRPVLPSLSAAVHTLLQSFGQVFATPTGQPPSQTQDHGILLKSTQPINVRSYRYPYIQKSKIEKIIHELLLTGVIRPSQSPFFGSGHVGTESRRKLAFMRRLQGPQ